MVAQEGQETPPLKPLRAGIVGLAVGFGAQALVRDIQTSSVTGPLPEIQPEGGFRVEGYRLEVVGHCGNCSG